MSSRVVKLNLRVPGPQSASMIKYLEGLADSVCTSQIEGPHSSVVLSAKHSGPDPKASEPKALNTLERYFQKK